MQEYLDTEILPELSKCEQGFYRLNDSFEAQFNQRYNKCMFKSDDDEFTGNQIKLGGIPIYVDKEVRDQVIPKPKQIIEKIFKNLSKIDKYETVINYDSNRSLDNGPEINSFDNLFTVKVRKAMHELERRDKQLRASWLDSRPYFKVHFKDVIREVTMEEDESFLVSMPKVKKNIKNN